ncbi:hypothetical protein H2199_004165 [Coniosporium tulheliwenetii]|uniref:Uncharacterized protein n=1 Tax=Coniosporium tulheliwenetii TaxID=3383036 RepID=A0ACC2Z8D6_9PEZI|nr:hypothetical protein H2199_004165 [Cladosporium sp. JES 115]
MARATASPERRPERRPPRPRGRNGEPPKKRLRYVPGGPGGGGRYVDPDTGQEIPVGGTGPGGYAYSGSRGRIGRENAVNGVIPPTPAPPPRSQTAVRDRPRRERPERTPALPRYNSTAAQAVSVAQSDGYKPREERGWEEFHQDLDIDADFMVFSAAEVDGIASPELKPAYLGQDLGEHGQASENGASSLMDEAAPSYTAQGSPELLRQASTASLPNGDTINLNGKTRAAGAPGESMLAGLGSPPVQRIRPLPSQNPKEKLNLPKPVYRRVDTFSSYEQDQKVQVNYVDKSLANVGYQESDIYVRPEKTLIRLAEGSIEEDLDLAMALKSDGDLAVSGLGVGRVEYDMDEQDDRWLEAYNDHRKEEQVDAIKPALFEITMTLIEKEWHALEKRIPKPNPKPPQTHRPRSSSAAAVNGEPAGAGEEQDTKCAICDDGDCENTNAIVFCDGCDLAVHQECYGVPFIPEGQWLCRKCQLIGRGTPTCIFCPNVDGAFKQTNTSRWSHLLCAIWIPEVTLGNNTFMEPVMDVEKVPKQRWKLTCYICHQKMGACIQCGNKNCYQAFHVTCARRAKLFLKMKSSHSGSSIIDASVLKAFCDKHCPTDWRKEHDVATAIEEAKDWYRANMRGRRWADSQQSALAFTSRQISTSDGLIPVNGPQDDSAMTANNKRKRTGPPKGMWRLPSGAPIVPQAVFHNVENSLIRFAIRKRKEFVAEACKYWTLKREARRGAALLKRLQLQMETFTSMEITRRNYVGMGAAGRPRLHRRIEFAERLEDDMEQIRVLCQRIKEREAEKLRDVELLRELVDTIYFPIPPLLWPALERAQTLDNKGFFREGLDVMQAKLEERHYASVSQFAEELVAVLSTVVARPPNITEVIEAPLSSEGSTNSALSADQKDKRKLAKRILKAAKVHLEIAIRKESDLVRQPLHLPDLDALMDASIRSEQESILPTLHDGSFVADGEARQDEEMEADSTLREGIPIDPNLFLPADTLLQPAANSASAFADETTDDAVIRLQLQPNDPSSTVPIGNANPLPSDLIDPALTSTSTKHQAPLTPPRSEKDPSPLAGGGIPWYLEVFDPAGTTVYEERWTGREVLRGMSEELSEMGDEELDGMGEEEEMSMNEMAAIGAGASVAEPPAVREETPVVEEAQVLRKGKGWRKGMKGAGRRK